MFEGHFIHSWPKINRFPLHELSHFCSLYRTFIISGVSQLQHIPTVSMSGTFFGHFKIFVGLPPILLKISRFSQTALHSSFLSKLHLVSTIISSLVSQEKHKLFHDLRGLSSGQIISLFPWGAFLSFSHNGFGVSCPLSKQFPCSSI